MWFQVLQEAPAAGAHRSSRDQNLVGNQNLVQKSPGGTRNQNLIRNQDLTEEGLGTQTWSKRVQEGPGARTWSWALPRPSVWEAKQKRENPNPSGGLTPSESVGGGDEGWVVARNLLRS